MANITYFPAVSPTGVGFGTVTTATSTLIVVADDFGNRDEYRGSNFTYGSNTVTGGQVNQYDGFINNVQVVSITGLNVFAPDIASLVLSGQIEAVFQTFLAGADLATGSSGADLIKVYAGNDMVNAGDGNDTVFGGDGNDTLAGAAGQDLLNGDLGNNSLSGGDGVDTLVGGLGLDTMTGGAGDDLYQVQSAGTALVEALAGGNDQVESWVSFTLAANLERLTLLGAAALDGYGNDLANLLTGNAGANLLSGAGGADTLDGAAGDDIYIVDDVLDTIIDASGSDTARASVGSYSLAPEIENLELTGAVVSGAGNALANRLTGNAVANLLQGLDGDDTLDGGQGADTLDGGQGNDQYILLDGPDILLDAGGIDQVVTSIDGYILGAGFENLSLAGAALAGSGNALANQIGGNNNANLLDGKAGADTMSGGAGDDSYAVDSGGDVIVELDGEGDDLVEASVAHGLDAFVERLVLTGLLNIDGMGNDLDNTITGNAGNNAIDGGAGADSLLGGAGDDTYLVNITADSVTELAGGGLDTVLSTAVNHTLSAHVENLVLELYAYGGTGNALDNSITGNGYSNRIDGGLGADTMAGGLGFDVYVVEDEGDLVLEELVSTSDKYDLVESWIDYTLPQYAEYLTLQGSAPLSGSGNSDGNEVITGNAANNVLNGGGGFNDDIFGMGGDDTLVQLEGHALMHGGTGDDRYVVGASYWIAENTDEGNDTVLSYGTFDLSLSGANVENLTLLDGQFATGNGLDNQLTGNGQNNVLDGKAGDDSLQGGAGADSLYGGAGLDTASYAQAAAAVTASLSLGSATDGGDDDFLLDIENLEGGAGNDSLDGDGFANGLDGGNGNDTLSGLAGDDSLDGGPGADRMLGGDGSDSYYVDSLTDVVLEATVDAAAGGIDTVFATYSYLLGANQENLTLFGAAAASGAASAQTNQLTGNALNNRLTGGQRDDTLDGGAGLDTMAGGDGDDSYYVRNLGDLVIEGASAIGGTDTVLAYYGGYLLAANVENGRIVPSLAASLSGNAGHNILFAGAGNNSLTGGLGSDTASYAYATAAVTIGLNAGAQATGGSGTDTLIGIENLTGSVFDDSLSGNAQANVLDGGLGLDAMAGGDGNDTYHVRDVGDSVSETNAASSGGSDLVWSYLSSYVLGSHVENGRILASSNADLYGNALNNTLYAGAGDNVLSGAQGTDTVSYLYADSGVVAGLVAGAQITFGSGNDSFDSVENISGSNFADSLSGDAGANILDGGAGVDTMAGGGGNDTYVIRNLGDSIIEFNTAGAGSADLALAYYGGYTLAANVENGRVMVTVAAKLNGNAGNNILCAGTGSNTLNGGAGLDTASYQFATAGISASLALVGSQATGGSGDDAFVGIENLMGSSYADSLAGAASNNTLFGLSGDDILDGGASNDLLIGGLGKDSLTGGSGADRFDFNDLAESGVGAAQRDVVNDFSAAQGDKIDLSTLDAHADAPGDQSFVGFAGGAVFSEDTTFSAAGQLFFEASTHLLYGNVDADTQPEFAIELVGVTALSMVNLLA